VATIITDGRPPGASAPGTRIDAFLRNASASNNMGVNGSSVAVPFFFLPDQTRRCELNRILFSIRDNGASGPDEFGAIANGISTGITLKVLDSGDNVIHDFLDGETITTNGGFADFCYDVDNMGQGLTGDDIYAVRWTFAAAGKAVTFAPGLGQRLEITIADDLSSLVWFKALVQGFYVG
jgi:hypothetical protein